MTARIHQLALILRAHGATAPLGVLEADAAFLLCTNPAEALHRLIQAAAKEANPRPEPGPRPSRTPRRPATPTRLRRRSGPVRTPAPAGQAAPDTGQAG